MNRIMPRLVAEQEYIPARSSYERIISGTVNANWVALRLAASLCANFVKVDYIIANRDFSGIDLAYDDANSYKRHSTE